MTSGKGPFRIAVYGKGGIGKSTISANISYELASRGYRVLQVGCRPDLRPFFLYPHNLSTNDYRVEGDHFG